MTKDVEGATYRAAGANNPPPLHVRSVAPDGNWYPTPRPYTHPTDAGPLMVNIPGLPADAYGEDPTDPARCHQARIPTPGLVARLDWRAGTPNVGARGERR